MANYLEISELLDLELRAKKVAMGSYDEILWKIRSGYLVVLACTLGFFVSEGSPLKLNNSMLIVVFWFSAAAWSIDVFSAGGS